MSIFQIDDLVLKCSATLFMTIAIGLAFLMVYVLYIGLFNKTDNEDPVCFEQQHIERIELVGEGQHKGK